MVDIMPELQPPRVTEDMLDEDIVNQNPSKSISSNSPSLQSNDLPTNSEKTSTQSPSDTVIKTSTQSPSDGLCHTVIDSNSVNLNTTVLKLPTVEEREAILKQLNDFGPIQTNEEEEFDYENTIIPDADCMIIDNEDCTAQFRSTAVYYLPQKYVLYFDPLKINKTKQYASNLERITQFITIQEFWRTWNHMQEQQIGMLSVFRDPVEPMWEHKENAYGGRYNLTTVAPNDRFKFFTELVVCLIGGLFQQVLDQSSEKEKAPIDEILGVQLKKTKKNWGITIWNKNANERNVRRFDRFVRDVLNMKENSNFVIEYRSHKGHIVLNHADYSGKGL